MRIAVHAPSVVAGGPLELAVRGLAGRGHAVSLAGRPGAGSALAGLTPKPGEPAKRDPVDVVIGGPRPLGACALALLRPAHALVLALEAPIHARWSPLERWAWAAFQAGGVIHDGDAPAFLARMRDEERERIALWSGASEGGEPCTHPDTTVLERACERALARRIAGPGRAALFVDRDGTLIEERHHLSDPDGVALIPGVPEALRSARAQGHPVVVVSNQAGVGRGLYPESRVHAVMARTRELLRREGVELDAVRHCPHAPDLGCECRKPGTLLLRQAAEDLRLSLADSVMVGDKRSDVEAGRAVRAAAVLVRTGHGSDEAGSGAGEAADVVLADLPAAVRWFLDRSAT